jgi:hypothetical protein
LLLVGIVRGFVRVFVLSFQGNVAFYVEPPMKKRYIVYNSTRDLLPT